MTRDPIEHPRALVLHRDDEGRQQANNCEADGGCQDKQYWPPGKEKPWDKVEVISVEIEYGKYTAKDVPDKSPRQPYAMRPTRTAKKEGGGQKYGTAQYVENDLSGPMAHGGCKFV